MDKTIQNTIFCKFCREAIPENAIICTHCGRQVEKLSNEQPSIVINNSNNINNSTNNSRLSPKNKWISLLLCIFLGFFGAHKFYEGKNSMGIIYLFTFGLLGFGWLIDIFILLFKPNPYYI